MMLVLWAFVAVFYFAFAPQITATARAFDLLSASEGAYLDTVTRRLEQHYRLNAAAIDSGPAYSITAAQLLAQLGIEPRLTLRLAISDRLNGSEVRFRRFAVWMKRTEPDSTVFDVATGSFTPGQGVAYRIVDGEAIQGALLEETLTRMKRFAQQLERRFRAKFEGDPLRSLNVNHFRPLGPACSTDTDDIPCIDSHTSAALAADFTTLLSVDAGTLVSAWGEPLTVSNREDSRWTTPPYSMAVRSALPWGGSVLVNAIQPLN